ncbi:MAG: glycosyltransferase family 4 protein [Parachlamydiales bacterium]|nr:glycosyltransferase family 4 protein [Parachlamydiales bacterium]
MNLKFCLIGHTEHTTRNFFSNQGMGEVVHAKKFRQQLINGGYSSGNILDVYELFGTKEQLDRFAEINHSLASHGFQIIDDFPNSELSAAKKHLEADGHIYIVLSYDWILSAVTGLGLHLKAPLITKSYSPTNGRRVHPALYEKSTLVITECLAANIESIKAGIPAWKMLYIPHSFPDSINKTTKDPEYLKKLAKENNKNISFTDKTLVVGMVTRFKQGKNMVPALLAFKKIQKEFPDAIFVLKGGYDGVVEGTVKLKRILKQFLKKMQRESWFLWDRSFNSFPKVLEEFSCFDICVHPSGIDTASNTIVEFMALGKPCLVLEEQTNPYLFKGGVEMIKPASKLRLWNDFHYLTPDIDHLASLFKQYLSDEKLRKELGDRAKDVAQKRFSSEQTLKRIPLLIESALSFYHQLPTQESYRKKIVRQYEEDLELYGIVNNSMTFHPGASIS